MSFMLLLILALVAFLVQRIVIKLRRKTLRGTSSKSVGFLHPFALSGGGGERVLWSAVIVCQEQYPGLPIFILGAWPQADAEQNVDLARRKARSHFGIDLSKVSFIPVDISNLTELVNPLRYPRLTLILQGLGTLFLGARAYSRAPTDVFIDTANLAFALPFPKLMGARTMSYVHYPTISTDMVETVSRREIRVHNNAALAASPTKTALKLLYYRGFAKVYMFISQFIDVAVANSSWTKAHLARMWVREVPVVFPPCSLWTEKVNGDDADTSATRNEGLVVSVGQFRPEKRHDEQVKIMKSVSQSENGVRLVMVGGARNEEDKKRAEKVNLLAMQQGVSAEIRLNASKEDLSSLLQKATIGLHTMRDEHFGIGVVELMSAGLVVIAHRSGGVALDIIQDGVTGFLADDETGFAEAICRALRMSTEERMELTKAAVSSCSRFTDVTFRNGFVQELRKAVLL